MTLLTSGRSTSMTPQVLLGLHLCPAQLPLICIFVAVPLFLMAMYWSQAPRLPLPDDTSSIMWLGIAGHKQRIGLPLWSILCHWYWVRGWWFFGRFHQLLSWNTSMPVEHLRRLPTLIQRRSMRRLQQQLFPLVGSLICQGAAQGSSKQVELKLIDITAHSFWRSSAQSKSVHFIVKTKSKQQQNAQI